MRPQRCPISPRTIRRIMSPPAILLFALFVFPARAMAQTPPEPGPHVVRGLALRLDFIDYSGWAFTETSPGVSDVRHGNGDANGFGLAIAYAPHPAVALTAAADISLHGQTDPSAVSFQTIGIELRRARPRSVIPSLNLSAGRFMDSGNREVPIAVLGVSVDYFLFRHVAVRTGLQFSRALGDGSRDGDPARAVKLDDAPQRFHLGLSWYPGVP